MRKRFVSFVWKYKRNITENFSLACCFVILFSVSLYTNFFYFILFLEMYQATNRTSQPSSPQHHLFYIPKKNLMMQNINYTPYTSFEWLNGLYKNVHEFKKEKRMVKGTHKLIRNKEKYTIFLSKRLAKKLTKVRDDNKGFFFSYIV